MLARYGANATRSAPMGSIVMDCLAMPTDIMRSPSRLRPCTNASDISVNAVMVIGTLNTAYGSVYHNLA